MEASNHSVKQHCHSEQREESLTIFSSGTEMSTNLRGILLGLRLVPVMPDLVPGIHAFTVLSFKTGQARP